MRLFTQLLFLLIAGAFIATPFALTAQNKKYSLSGQVRDSITALPIKNPLILVAGTTYKAVGDTLGNYRIENLIPGTNNLVVWAPGYDTAVQKFEIRRDMKLNAKLFKHKDTAKEKTIAIPADTVKKDSVKKNVPVEKPEKDKKKDKKMSLSDTDKEQIMVLIEDAIFAKSIYFSNVKEKKGKVYIEGSFTIDTGYIYDFTSVFTRKDAGFEMSVFNITLKGKTGL